MRTTFLMGSESMKDVETKDVEMKDVETKDVETKADEPSVNHEQQSVLVRNLLDKVFAGRSLSGVPDVDAVVNCAGVLQDGAWCLHRRVAPQSRHQPMLLKDLAAACEHAVRTYGGDRELLIDVEARKFDYHYARVLHASMVCGDEVYLDHPELLKHRDTSFFFLVAE